MFDSKKWLKQRNSYLAYNMITFIKYELIKEQETKHFPYYLIQKNWLLHTSTDYFAEKILIWEENKFSGSQYKSKIG